VPNCACRPWPLTPRLQGGSGGSWTAPAPRSDGLPGPPRCGARGGGVARITAGGGGRKRGGSDEDGASRGASPGPKRRRAAEGAPLRVGPAPPLPRTRWTRRVRRPVLIGHAASLTPYGPARARHCAALLRARADAPRRAVQVWERPSQGEGGGRVVVRWALGESGGAGAPGDSAIRAALQGFGEVVSVRAVPKRGLAFVTLASGAAASAALSAGAAGLQCAGAMLQVTRS